VADDQERSGGGGQGRRRRWPLWLTAALVVLAAAGAYWIYGIGGGITDRGPGQEDPGAGSTAEAGPGGSEPAGGAAGQSSAGSDVAGGTGADAGSGPGDAAAAGEPATAGEPGAPAATTAPADTTRPETPASAGEPPVGPPARGVERVSWERRDGATEVVVLADGALPAGAATHQRIGGAAPRELFRLRGIARPLVPATVEVGSPQLQRVRAGHHPELEPDELHLVLDLAGPGVEVTEARVDGRRLVIRLEGR
jgi:hypothetical protein